MIAQRTLIFAYFRLGCELVAATIDAAKAAELNWISTVLVSLD